MEVHREIIAAIAGHAATIEALLLKLREVRATSKERDLLIYTGKLLKLLESPLFGGKVSINEVRRSSPCVELLAYCERNSGDRPA